MIGPTTTTGRRGLFGLFRKHDESDAAHSPTPEAQQQPPVKGQYLNQCPTQGLGVNFINWFLLYAELFVPYKAFFE